MQFQRSRVHVCRLSTSCPSSGFEYLWIQSKAKRIEIWRAERVVINSIWCGGKGRRLDKLFALRICLWEECDMAIS